MAYSTQKKGYLGFFIAGGVITASGGSLLAMGILYAWMGGFFQNMMDGIGDMDGMPSFSGIFGTMGFGMTIGGAIVLVVGLALLGTGMSKKKAYQASTSSPSVASDTRSGSNTGRENSYAPSPAYGTISVPVQASPPIVASCRSCGESLPEGSDAQFCPNCGSPTR